MSKVRILPEILSNKIAAGEVVERPCSVVKELIENAIDAKSSTIFVEIEKGGRSLIKISDNGIGMSSDDAMLAIERYATSKIYNDEDLFSISTLGFRGEALPSIASVSCFSLITRDKNSDTAACVNIEGGKIKNIYETGAPVGSVISVEQLFFNIPARRKFLKTINTEMGHIVETISSIALGWHNIQFILHHNGRLLKSWPSVQNSFDRVVDVLGMEVRKDLNEIKFNDDYISISGWISSPEITRSTSQKIYVFVNGRFVKNRVILHALFEGYKGRLMKGRYPVAVIFISVPFNEIDVNVHPAKQEVRFVDQTKVYNSLRDTVLKSLEKLEQSKWADIKIDNSSFIEKPANISESLSNYNKSSHINENISSFDKIDPDKIPPRDYESDNIEVKEDETYKSLPKKNFDNLKIIGQFFGTYIICESFSNLIIIDQHAAHERVVYESLKSGFNKHSMSIQRLLIPETFDLNYNEVYIMEKMTADFNKFGIEIEPFGGNTFVIKAVPALISDKEIKPLVVDIIAKVLEIGFKPDLTSNLPESLIDETLVIMACHSSIRANHTLALKEIQELINQLDRCENPSYCPHGRPTWFELDKLFFEKQFKRVAK